MPFFEDIQIGVSDSTLDIFRLIVSQIEISVAESGAKSNRGEL